MLIMDIVTRFCVQVLVKNFIWHSAQNIWNSEHNSALKTVFLAYEPGGLNQFDLYLLSTVTKKILKVEEFKTWISNLGSFVLLTFLLSASKMYPTLHACLTEIYFDTGMWTHWKQQLAHIPWTRQSKQKCNREISWKITKQTIYLPTSVWSVACGNRLSSSSRDNKPIGFCKNISKRGLLSSYSITLASTPSYRYSFCNKQQKAHYIYLYRTTSENNWWTANCRKLKLHGKSMLRC